MSDLPVFPGYKNNPEGKEMLFDKIDWEGGISEYFLHYASNVEGDSLIKEEVEEFRKAYHKLHNKLKELGL